MLTVIKRLFCKHKNRHFVRYLHGEEINTYNLKRFEYVCNDCGAYLYFDQPDDCCQCRHFYYNSDGSGACDLVSSGKACHERWLECWQEKAI